MSNALSFQADELNNSVLYIRASLSRIRDADYAHESTKLAKASILMEAATAMLVQANASKQGVLQLLKS
jgi:flagellin